MITILLFIKYQLSKFQQFYEFLSTKYLTIFYVLPKFGIQMHVKAISMNPVIFFFFTLQEKNLVKHLVLNRQVLVIISFRYSFRSLISIYRQQVRYRRFFKEVIIHNFLYRKSCMGKIYEKLIEKQEYLQNNGFRQNRFSFFIIIQ